MRVLRLASLFQKLAGSLWSDLRPYAELFNEEGLELERSGEIALSKWSYELSETVLDIMKTEEWWRISELPSLGDPMMTQFVRHLLQEAKTETGEFSKGEFSWARGAVSLMKDWPAITSH